MPAAGSDEGPQERADRAGAREPEGLTQADLYADVDVVQAYGAEHPEVFGMVWFEGPSVHVGLTQLSPHAAALQAVLVHPAAVHVHQVARTARELEAVADELLELMVSDGVVRQTSIGRECVEVQLRAGSSTVAAQLRARYGDAVDVVDADEDPTPPPAAQPGPTSTAQRPELQLEVLPAPDVLVGGEPGHGHLRITNGSRSVQELETAQPLEAYLLGPDGRISGSLSGFWSGTGLTLVLAAGESRDVAYVVGTETSGHRATTPGEHQLVVVLPLYDTGEVPGPPVQLVSPAVPVTVAAGDQHAAGPTG